MTVRQYHHEFGNHTDTIVRLGEEEYGQWMTMGERIVMSGGSDLGDAALATHTN